MSSAAAAKANNENSLAEEVKRLTSEMKAMEKDMHDRILELQLSVRALELVILSKEQAQ
jgi:hypothetical protein